MKVTFVGHTIPQSGVVGVSAGISRYIYYLGDAVRRHGNDVELLIRDDLKPKESWIKTVRAPKFGWMPYPFFLYRRIKNIESDIFHADYVHTGAPLIWAKKRPTVVSVHDVLPFSYDRKDLTAMDKVRVAWYMMNFKTISKADAVILASEVAKNEAIEKTRIPEENIHAIHYGVDTNMLKPSKKEKSDILRIGYLGGLDGRKNVGLLVEAFGKIADRYSNVELHLGGTGRNFEKFKSMKVPRMVMHGPIKYEDTPKFLNSLDVFVFPTLGEGFGLPVCEAMACGIPVVASNVTTMPEIVGDSGILSEPDVDSMVDALSKIIENSRLRKELAKKSFEKSKMFTWEAAAEKTIKVYKSVIS